MATGVSTSAPPTPGPAVRRGGRVPGRVRVEQVPRPRQADRDRRRAPPALEPLRAARPDAAGSDPRGDGVLPRDARSRGDLAGPRVRGDGAGAGVVVPRRVLADAARVGQPGGAGRARGAACDRAGRAGGLSPSPLEPPRMSAPLE